MNKIKVVGVVGAGTMGNGIAHVFARGGFQVVLCEVEQRFLDRGLETIRKNLEREAAKGKLSADGGGSDSEIDSWHLAWQRPGDVRFCDRSRAGAF